MKKFAFTLPFKSNFFKEQDPFHLVIVFFIIFFGTAVFFSIPTFYDYKKYNRQIEETINKEFKINMHNLEDISFRFIPSPHLLIKKADFKIRENETNLISELKDIKVFFSIAEFYSEEKFKIKKIIVNKENFYLNNLSLKNFIYNFKKNIVNNFIIKRSTLFFKDQDGEVILISTFKDFNYKVDLINLKKLLTIEGNVFDLDYKFKYQIDYETPNIQTIIFETKNPNVFIQNQIEDNIYNSSLEQIGNFEIKFLNLKNSLNYKITDNNIEFIGDNKKNSTFNLKGLINISPFHFDLVLEIKKINLLELEQILFYILDNIKNEYENFSGNFKINFNNLNNKIINKGTIDLFFENSKLYINQSLFNLGKFAKIDVIKYEYLDNENQILESKIKLNITDSEKFNKFLFNYKKNKILSKNLYFTYKFNVNTGDSFISKISQKKFYDPVEFYKFNNWQQLRNIIKDEDLIKMD